MEDLSGHFRPIPIKIFPKSIDSISDEAHYWKKWLPVLLQQHHPVTDVSFNPVTPYQFAVTSHTKVQIFDPNTNEIMKTMSRFKDTAYGGTFRNDGQLLVAGGEEGIVRLFDVSTHGLLRSLKGHERSVHVTKFSSNKIHVLSGSDDKTIKCWDLVSSEALLTLKGHEDHIRSGTVTPASQDVWVSGSYDHTVRLWDIRTGITINTFDHGAPVEDVLVNPNASILVSAGGNQVKIWNLFKAQLECTLENHQKTVTALALDHTTSKLFTASLDHHVKIFSTENYSLIHTMRYASPILCIAFSPAQTHLVTGMSDGMLSIRHRAKAPKAPPIQENQTTVGILPQPSTRSNLSVVGNRNEPIRLTKYDKLLQKYRYKQAMDEVLEEHDSVVVITLLEEFIHRNCLDIVLSGRDEKTLEPILIFVLKHLVNPKFSNTLLIVFNQLLDIYSPVLGQSQSIDRLFKEIRASVNKEVELQKQIFQTLGALDLLINANNLVVK